MISFWILGDDSGGNNCNTFLPFKACLASAERIALRSEACRTPDSGPRSDYTVRLTPPDHPSDCIVAKNQGARLWSSCNRSMAIRIPPIEI